VRLHRPELAAYARRAGAIGRLQVALDGLRERREIGVRSLLDQHGAVRKDDEPDGVAIDSRRLDRLRRLPFAGALHSVDADLLPRATRLPLDEAALAGEALVQRLLLPEQAQASASSACLSILRFADLRSRSFFTWRRSFALSSSIDAFMSRVASRWRSVW